MYGNPLDIDKYRNEFDTDEQWKVKRDFMLTYMDRFTEDRLVCLAQVLFNIKYLGCKYPDKTMSLVEHLSTTVRHNFSEEELKPRLKRTLVEAQTAATAKVQRKSYMDVKVDSIPQVPVKQEQPNKSQFTQQQNTQIVGQRNVQPALRGPESLMKFEASIMPNAGQGGTAAAPQTSSLLRDMQSRKGPIQALVVMKIGQEHPFTELQRNSGIWKRPFCLTWEKLGGGKWFASVRFDGVLLSEVFGTRKPSKKMACDIALWKLQTCFYAAQMTRDSTAEYYFERCDKNVKTGKSTYETNARMSPANKDAKISSDSDFESMLIFVQLPDSYKYDENNERDRSKILELLSVYIDDYKENEEECRELMFVRQYSYELYKELFSYGNNLGLKCRYVGSNEKRVLVVYKQNMKFKPPWQVIQNLLVTGKEYVDGLQIIPPGSRERPHDDNITLVNSDAQWNPPI